MNKIEKYVFIEILKGSFLILFIFLSISWLLQFTRLISLTNFIQVDIITIFYLSIFLIPNLISVIIPFVIIFGLIITFIKLHRDKEIISIYSLGLNTKVFSNPLIFFTLIIFIILLSFNFYIAPKVYKQYKLKEYDIRNKIDFEKIVISNFIEINNNTFLDFKRDKNKYKEVFIKFKDNNNNNIIYSKEAKISQDKEKFVFKLIDGFRISLNEDKKLEKLEFENYNLKITNNSYKDYDNFDKNTFSIFEDLINKNYINIIHKSSDSLMVIIIILFFYFNSIKVNKFENYNIFVFIIFSSVILIINQFLKNIEISFVFYFIILVFILISSIVYFLLKKNNV